MFTAGIIPGCLIAATIMFYCWFYCKRHGEDKAKIAENGGVGSDGILQQLGHVLDGDGPIDEETHDQRVKHGDALKSSLTSSPTSRAKRPPASPAPWW